MKKNFIKFALICAWFMGTVGGFGYACYSKAYLIAACVAIVGAIAFPQVKRWWKELMM